MIPGAGPLWPPSLSRIATLAGGGARYLLARATGSDAWLSVTLLVTLRCNLHCRYCDFPRHATEHEMDTRAVLRLLTQLRRAGTVRVSISGGEPLLRPDIGEICRHAMSLGLITSLVTNGTLLSDRADEVRGVDYLFCTLEGVDEVHDVQRGRRAWERTTRGIAAVRRGRSPRLGIICPVHQGNLEHLDGVLQRAESMGGVKVFFQPVQKIQGWRGPTFDGYPDEAKLQQVFLQLARWKKSGRPVGNSRYYLSMVASRRWPALSGRCLAGRFFVTVLPDGRATPCCMLPFDGPTLQVSPQLPGGALPRHPQLYAGECGGCTISPYVESHLLLSLSWRSLWGALTI